MVALIILIAMTLAGLALMRSVDTSTLIAGNMAFKQAATHSGDSGIETAIAWIENNGALLNSDQGASGYASNGLTAAPAPNAGESWEAYWARVWGPRPPVTMNPDAAGNTASYVIDRLCAFAGSPTGGASCSSSPLVATATGNAEEAGEGQLNATALVYYRITARITGPRNTVSFVQAMIAR